MTKQLVSVNVDISKIAPKVINATKRAKHAVAEQVLKDSNSFVPADIWNLRDSSLRFSNLEEGQLVWQTPYARKLYFGVRFNFSRDKNPNAGPLWYERARAAYLPQWQNVAKRTVEQNL
ncbi:minor capsid protein [Alkalihalophilus marmarensis]|uniref:minor capsid protein n=1 Tax=Alkalihalophilus marmarensis TaxID=521377 RepID=UPI002E229BF4|nr:minor capsid protein [Alkalihalophilus marmarensis]